ncbi:hypothetical protein GM921_04985 [Pedobacter sp. LMG 31464]|uniref:Uncharacterized protein n=1 Tax=Pedobacter planticolens TaxID=2679964 RepID=A0A923DVR2_9SPHI|nr:hypothetical protein [Pedobacter planticolens]MBB2144827.1 hypothetical protein [Pedobacter planticolens]
MESTTKPHSIDKKLQIVMWLMSGLAILTYFFVLKYEPIKNIAIRELQPYLFISLLLASIIRYWYPKVGFILHSLICLFLTCYLLF